jgi:hypothetical protein
LFFNRPEQVILTRNKRDPKTFLQDANRQIDQVFGEAPLDDPALERLQDSFVKGQGKDIARYFGDGTPTVV